MKWVILALLLTGCSAEVCKTVTIERTVILPPKVVNRVIVIRDRSQPKSQLIRQYVQTLNTEKPLVIHSQAPVINHLEVLNEQVRDALVPLENLHHPPSFDDIENAKRALTALQVYIGQKKH